MHKSVIVWRNVNMNESISKDYLIRTFPEVFADKIGAIKCSPVSIK